MKNIVIQISNDKRSVNNNIFNPKMDINWSVYKNIKEYLSKQDISISTFDKYPTDKADLLIFIDTPYPWDTVTWDLIKANKDKSILFCCEPPIINPFNYLRIFNKYFSKIYTWNDDLVDDKKYFKFNWPQSEFGIDTKPVPFKKKKLLTLINGNKLPFLPFAMISPFGKELYSERIKALEYFEKNIPEDFDLYGKGWNKPKKRNVKEAVFGYKKYSSYKGEIDNKISVLSNYKFTLCFENLTNVNGYFTEKFFDALKARCVPIYWGADNIDSYIPESCFVDYRKINSYEKLIEFIENIDERSYNQYILSIEELLSNKKFKEQWFEKGFSKFFYNVIEKSIL